MKIFIKILLLVIFLSLFQFFPVDKIKAQDTGWTITSFNSAIEIRPDGKVTITEEISVDFDSLSKHGIFRRIPFIYQESGAKEKVYTNINIDSVLQDGKTILYELKDEGNYKNIKIGDPDKTVSGKVQYLIRYTVIGILKSYEDFDELYWNVTGAEWEVPINSAEATVYLPKNQIIQLFCYQGYIGSTENCESVKVPPLTATFKSTRILNPNEGVTVAVGFTKGTVPILVGTPPKSVFDDLFEVRSASIFIFVLVIGVVVVLSRWMQKGRDFWYKSRFIHDPLKRHEVRPLNSHETIVVEYSPPDNLRPAEVSLLLTESVNNKAITATLIDLASRGYLKIIEVGKKGLLGKVDYTLEKQKAVDTNLLGFEKLLLEKIFDKGDSVKLSSLKNSFYKHLPKIHDEIYKEALNKKFFVENPTKVRLIYSMLAFLILGIGGALVWLGFQAVISILVSVGASLIVVGLFAVVVAQLMPRRTATGRELYVRAKGYEMFVERAEKYKQQFYEKRNLFNEVLPYAIIFGVVEKFAKVFENLGIQPESPTWYSGRGAFNAVVFGSSLNSFSNSFTTTAASAPSSSGSGGGGSAGGGFGGGGGGSW